MGECMSIIGDKKENVFLLTIDDGESEWIDENNVLSSVEEIDMTKDDYLPYFVGPYMMRIPHAFKDKKKYRHLIFTSLCRKKYLKSYSVKGSDAYYYKEGINWKSIQDRINNEKHNREIDI